MTADVRRPDAAELLAHASRLRALALRIVREADDADDVVQGAMARALARPPREGTPLGAWLARVVRNLSFDARRRADARRRHEAHAPASPPAPRPDETAARAEAFRDLADAVAALEPIYREAVVLRFFDDLPAADVAARLGVPVETVRTRLKRALATLRDRLDRRHGGRAAWVALLLGGGDRATDGATVRRGGRALRIAAAAALVAGAFVGAWHVAAAPSVEDATDSAARGTDATPSGATSRRGAERRAAPRAAAPSDASAPTAEAVADAEPAAPGRFTSILHAADPSASLAIVAVDETGARVPGIVLGVTAADRHEWGEADATGTWRCRRPPGAASAYAEIQRAAGGRWFLEQSAPIPAGASEVRLVLTSADLVEGRVVDEAGAPVELLELEVRIGGRRVFQTNTERDGRFVARAPTRGTADLVLTGVAYERASGAVEPAPWKVVAAQSGAGADWEGRLDGVGGGATGLVLVARRTPWDATVAVRVVAPDGSPLAGVDVWAEHGAGPDRLFRGVGAATDADGRVRLPGLPRRGVRVRVGDGALAPPDALPPLPVDAAAGDAESLLAFRAATSVAGVVLAEGAFEPVAGCAVRVVAEDAVVLAETTTDERGAFRALVPADGPKALRVEVGDAARRVVCGVTSGAPPLRIVLGKERR